MGILIDIIIPWITVCTLIGIGGIAAFWFGAGAGAGAGPKDMRKIHDISEEEKELLK